jgi:hypothetical protein
MRRGGVRLEVVSAEEEKKESGADNASGRIFNEINRSPLWEPQLSS